MPLTRGLLVSVLLFALTGVAPSARAQVPAATSGMAHADSTAHPLIVNLSDLKWERMIPALGDKSSEIAILHEDREEGVRLYRTAIDLLVALQDVE